MLAVDKKCDAALPRRVLSATLKDGYPDASPTMLVLAVWAIVTTGVLVRTVIDGFDAFITDRISPDDALRLVQVRDFLAGQGWFDLTQYRLEPPEGLYMHWSRLVDFPVASLIRFGQLFASVPNAERWALSAWPLLLLLPLLGGIARLAYSLGGRPASVLALIITVLSPSICFQFLPGALDHHNVQLVLLIWILALLANERLGQGEAALAGGLAAASIAVGIEMLPAVATVALAMSFLWIVEGEQVRSRVTALALSFAAALLFLFILTVPRARFGNAACDALSIVHLTAGVAGGCGLAGLAYVLRTRSHFERLLGAAGLGLAVALLMLVFFPSCINDPRGALDPAISRLWAEHIAEAQPITSVARYMPQEILPVYGFIAIALPLSLLGARQAGVKWPWILPLSVLVVLFVLCLWLVRVAAGAVLIAVPLVAASLIRLLPGHRWRFVGIPAGALAVGLALGQTSLNALSQLGTQSAKWLGYSSPYTGFASRPCTKAATFAPLSKLPRGLVLGSVDTGPFILMSTPHSVVGAAYLRNGEAKGIQTILDIFLAPSDIAGARLLARGVDYVVFCPDDGEYSGYASEAPEGLAAALVKGDIPAYLQRVPLVGNPIVYRFDGTSL